MSSSNYKFLYNNVEYNLSDIIASGTTNVPTAENTGGKGVINTGIVSAFNPSGTIYPVTGAEVRSSVTSELSNVGVDGQNTGFFKLSSATNTIQDIGSNFTAYYTDYFTYTSNGLPYDHRGKGNGSDVNTTVNLPDWVDHIVVLAVGGGGYVGRGKSSDDQHWSSAEGGSGGFIAWKSPSGIKSYNVNIPRRHQGTHNGQHSTVRVYNSQNAINEVGWCQAHGGGHSVEPGGDDDDTDYNTIIGNGLNGGGGYGNHHGSVLFSAIGATGASGVGGAHYGYHGGSNNAQASRVHGWTNFFNNGPDFHRMIGGGVRLGPGQGAYWGQLVEYGGHANNPNQIKYNRREPYQWGEYQHIAGDDDDDREYKWTRVLGGCNGAVRVYLKAVDLS